MILMPHIFDVTANEKGRYKGKDLEYVFYSKMFLFQTSKIEIRLTAVVTTFLLTTTLSFQLVPDQSNFKNVPQDVNFYRLLLTYDETSTTPFTALPLRAIRGSSIQPPSSFNRSKKFNLGILLRRRPAKNDLVSRIMFSRKQKNRRGNHSYFNYIFHYLGMIKP